MKNLGFNLVKGKIQIELAIPVPRKILILSQQIQIENRQTRSELSNPCSP